MKLKNGMELRIVPSSNDTCVNIGLYFYGGAAGEGAEEIGINHLLEHLFFRRLGNLPHNILYSELDSIGAVMQGVTYYNFLRFDITVSKIFLKEALKFIPMFFSNFCWNKEEFESEKEVVKNQIFFGNYSSFYKQVENIFLESTGYDHPIMGDEDHINSFSLQQLNDLKANVVVPQNSFVVITGDVDKSDADFAMEILSGIAVRQGNRRKINNRRPLMFGRREERSDIIKETESDISEIILSFDVENDDKTRLTSLLVLQALAVGDGAILSRELREKKHFTDQIYFSFDEYPSFSRGCVYFLVKSENVAECLNCCLKIFTDFAADSNDSYLKDVLPFFTTNVPFSMSCPRDYNFEIAFKKINFQKETDFVNEERNFFEGMTSKNFNDYKKELFDPQRMVISVECNPDCENPAAVKKMLKKIKVRLR